MRGKQPLIDRLAQAAQDKSVHPRVCGGNPSKTISGGRERGYIPACAGETPYDLEVHPRVCGGNSRSQLHIDLVTLDSHGTSPRVRGKHQSPTLPSPGNRVHPRVCGGNPGQEMPASCKQVHPRVCGGNGVAAVSWWIVNGRVHPRVCGGNDYAVMCRCVADTGTSPRVRGKRRSGLPSAIPVVRYIPACAGETPLQRSATGWNRVHPRVCGGNCRRNFQAFRCRTTVHPRVCGGNACPPTNINGMPHRGGYIPACAGETSLPVGPVLINNPRVHPRVCGGNGAGPKLRIIPGTSPRVRGKPP